MVLTPWESGPKNRGMTWPEWSRERLIGVVCRRHRPALLIIPTEHSNIIQGSQKLQIAPAACCISETISAAGTSSI
jgi:hypothetical protein